MFIKLHSIPVKTMSERKHPILFGILIYSLVACGLLVLWGGITFFLKEDAGLGFGNRIGVVYIRGLITDSKGVVEQIKKYRKDNRVKAIILRIDSPGGGTAASQEIYREVQRTVTKKRVIAAMGNVAASGGYYVALAADKIVANPATLTGSIGVIMEVSNIKELLQKIGVSREAVKSGPYKDIGSPLREMKPEERRLLEEVIQNVHQQFIEVVSRGRRLSREQVEKIADGRIFTGQQAKTMGLVDELGSFEDAVELTKKMVGLSGEVKLIFSEKKRFSIWDLIFSEMMGDIKQSLQSNWPTTPQLLLVPPFFYQN
ncbi:MAG: signal peptide peptidase SppA [Deltaproteobacteria bacterium]|nr:signal peptide peptidase SppA [Deltaproteobacteria bacterium]